MQKRTLVFGDDGTPTADVAWLCLNSQEWPEWRVEIVRAVEYDDLTYRPREQTELHPWQPELPRVAFPSAQFEEIVYLTADGDARLVLERACDLLVIGPRGPGFAKSLHLGSTSDWLLRRPPAPLLIARHGNAIRRVVIATDGSVHAGRAIEALITLPWAKHLEVFVISVNDHRVVDVNEAVHRATQRLEPAVKSIKFCVDVGKPTTIILRYLDEMRADLVVMGTRGLTGLRRLRLGSTASAVAHIAECSILVSCAPDEDD